MLCVATGSFCTTGLQCMHSVLGSSACWDILQWAATFVDRALRNLQPNDAGRIQIQLQITYICKYTKIHKV